MKSFADILQASFWFLLCVAAAFFLLTVAVVYNGYLLLKKDFGLKKITLPKFQIAR